MNNRYTKIPFSKREGLADNITEVMYLQEVLNITYLRNNYST